MIRKRSARALAGGLIAVLLLISASAAYAAVSGSFSGTTNQKQSISMHVGHGSVTRLQFHVKDTCPSGHVYIIHDLNFPGIKINKLHKFDAKFVSTSTKAQAEISGTVSKSEIKGKVLDVHFIKSEHHNCTGVTRYTVHKQ
jgi:hypothetical protein